MHLSDKEYYRIPETFVGVEFEDSIFFRDGTPVRTGQKFMAINSAEGGPAAILRAKKQLVRKCFGWRAVNSSYDYDSMESQPNELIGGFQVVINSTQGKWNNAFAKSIPVKDPRGFYTRISLANVFNLYREGLVDVDGNISGRCLYAKSGQHIILLPENSKPYKDSVAFTEIKKAKRVNPKTVAPGSMVYLDGKLDPLPFVGVGKLRFTKKYAHGTSTPPTNTPLVVVMEDGGLSTYSINSIKLVDKVLTTPIPSIMGLPVANKFHISGLYGWEISHLDFA